MDRFLVLLTCLAFLEMMIVPNQPRTDRVWLKDRKHDRAVALGATTAGLIEGKRRSVAAAGLATLDRPHSDLTNLSGTSAAHKGVLTVTA